MNDFEELWEKVAGLVKRAESLEKRFDKLAGKIDGFPPKINAIMRKGSSACDLFQAFFNRR